MSAPEGGREIRTIRVLVADDEPLITAGIRTVLESAAGIEVVAEAANGRAAVDETVRRRIDVALMDINMPEMDGLTAIEQISRRAPSTRFVILTAFGDEPNVRRAVENGAAGFVLKNCAPDELIRAVRSAHAGQAYLSPAVARLVLGMVDPDGDGRREEARRRLAALSPRESEILHLVAEGMSNAETGRRLHMSETTIKTYMSRILAKLDCTNRVQAALLVRDAGTLP
jgi:DNA-binding NarL/FixJ family response regulator